MVGEIHARDAEHAATKAAEVYDSDDAPLSRGNEVVIEVRAMGSEEVTRWTARAEMQPHYYVDEADDD